MTKMTTCYHGILLFGCFVMAIGFHIPVSESFVRGSSKTGSCHSSCRMIAVQDGAIIENLGIQPSKQRQRVEELTEPESAQLLMNLLVTYRSAQASLQTSEEAGVGVDGFVALSKQCMDSGLPAAALDVYLTFKSAALSSASVNDRSYLSNASLVTTTLKAYLKLGRLHEALQLLQEAKDANVKKNSGMNSVIISSLCLCGRAGLEAALALHLSMRARGQRLTPKASLSLLEAASTAGKRGFDSEGSLTNDVVSSVDVSEGVAGRPFSAVFALSTVEELLEDFKVETPSSALSKGGKQTSKTKETPKLPDVIKKQAGSHLLRGAFTSTFARIGDKSTSARLTQSEIDGLGKLALSEGLSAVTRHNLELNFNALEAGFEACLGCNYTQGAAEVLELMRENGIWTQTSTYNTILLYYRDHCDASAALGILELVRTSAQGPDANTITLAMQACAWDTNPGASASVALLSFAAIAGAKGEKNGYVTDTKQKKALLDAIAAAQFGAGMPLEEVLAGITKRKGEVNSETFKSIIEACAFRKDVSGAFFVLKYMQNLVADTERKGKHNIKHEQRSADLRLTKDFYISMLQACAAGEHPEDGETALKVLDMMLSNAKSSVATKAYDSAAESPPVPDAQCYEYVIKTLCSSAVNRVDDALALLSDMETASLTATEDTYASIVRGLGGKLELGRALGAWQEILQRFDKPKMSSYEAAIDACIAHPQGLQRATSIIKDMKAAGYSLALGHYTVLIRGFGDSRNLEAALSVFAEAQGGEKKATGLGGVEVSEDIYSALLEACVRSGAASGASDGVRVLKSKGIKPPGAIMSYLSVGQIESPLYDAVFGKREQVAVAILKRSPTEQASWDALGLGSMRQKTEPSASTGGSMGYASTKELLMARLSKLEEERIQAENRVASGIDLLVNLSRPQSSRVKYTEVADREERANAVKRRREGEARSRERKKQRNATSGNPEGGDANR